MTPAQRQLPGAWTAPDGGTDDMNATPACRDHSGTYNGYMRHKAAGDEPCPPCREGARLYWRAKERRRRLGLDLRMGDSLPPIPPCRSCGAELARPEGKGPPPKYCDGCRETDSERYRRRYGVPDFRVLTCANCGKEWKREPTRGQQPRWCSDACGGAVRRADRRAREIDAFVAPVAHCKIFERDGWRCGICGKKVDKRKRWPDPMAATIDHIIPYAAGGTHEPANVQCAHGRCNSSKRDRAANDQLRLIG